MISLHCQSSPPMPVEEQCVIVIECDVSVEPLVTYLAGMHVYIVAHMHIHVNVNVNAK